MRDPHDTEPVPTEVDLVCSADECGLRWTQEAVRDSGFVETVDAPECPECGTEGVDA